MRSRPGFQVYAWSVLVFILAVILWGAYVRATGSGAGCGNHWPLCNGEMVPREATAATMIEYTHRATSGLALLAIVGLVAWAWRAYQSGHPVRRWAAWSMALIVVEALLGAGLVLLEHVAKNVSLARGWSMSLHLVNTLALLAVLSLTAWWARPAALAASRAVAGRAWIWALALYGVIGVTGAIAALGDTLFPASSVTQAWQADFNSGSHLFVRLRWLHPLVGIAVSGGLLLLIWRKAPGRWAAVLTGLMFAQITLGAINVILLAPVWLQLIHLLAGDALWIGMVLCVAATADRDARAA